MFLTKHPGEQFNFRTLIFQDQGTVFSTLQNVSLRKG